MDFLALRYAVYNAAHTLTHGFTYKSVIGAILGGIAAQACRPIS